MPVSHQVLLAAVSQNVCITYLFSIQLIILCQISRLNCNGLLRKIINFLFSDIYHRFFLKNFKARLFFFYCNHNLWYSMN